MFAIIKNLAAALAIVVESRRRSAKHRSHEKRDGEAGTPEKFCLFSETFQLKLPHLCIFVII